MPENTRPLQAADAGARQLGRRELLAGGAAALASLATGNLLIDRVWPGIITEDLVPGRPPHIELGPRARDATADRVSFTPREAAEAAWRPGGPSVEELERRLRRQRGL